MKVVRIKHSCWWSCLTVILQQAAGVAILRGCNKKVVLALCLYAARRLSPQYGVGIYLTAPLGSRLRVGRLSVPPRFGSGGSLLWKSVEEGGDRTRLAMGAVVVTTTPLHLGFSSVLGYLSVVWPASHVVRFHGTSAISRGLVF